MDQRKLILKVVRNCWDVRCRKHNNGQVQGLFWMVLKDHDERWDYCNDCITELFEFYPQATRIMRAEHVCDKCGKKAPGAVLKDFLADNRTFVCIECLKRYCDD